MALENASITNTITGAAIQVMFNPSDYTLSQDINYAQAAVPGLSAPLLQFVNGNTPTLEMELFLDTYESNVQNGQTINQAGADVRTLTSQVIGLMSIDSDSHAPPVLLFTWASLSFTCVLARVVQKFIMFLSDGTPVRAKLQVLFQGYSNGETEAKEVKRQTANYSKNYVVASGDNLSMIAWRVYGDPTKWRPIGIYNSIAEPLDLTVGTPLTIPTLPFVDPETGEVVR